MWADAILRVGWLHCLGLCGQEPTPAQLAHFHHVHLNVTDPAAAIEFYTSKFDIEKAKFAGLSDAVWAQKPKATDEAAG